MSQKLLAAAHAGFDSIDLDELDITGFDGELAEIAAQLSDLNLIANSLAPNRDFEIFGSDDSGNQFDRLEAKFDLMHALGVGLMVLQASSRTDSVNGDSAIMDILGEAGERASARGLKIAYQALGWALHVKSDEHAASLIAGLGHPSIGLALNSLQSCRGRSDWSAPDSATAENIFFVQLSDAPELDMGDRILSQHFQCFLGLGALDLKNFVRQIAATGYEDGWSFAVRNDKLREASARTLAQDGYRSLLSLLDDAGNKRAASLSKIAALPEKGDVEAVEFIEFAVGPGDVEQLSGLLAKLGFRQSARHISKDVDLWRQGSARIVLNRETKDFARSSYLTHGTSVCDIGLHVGDAKNTHVRAVALGANVFHQPTGPDELEVPAIRGIGGSVLHLLDSTSELAKIWDQEFTPTTTDVEAVEFGLTEIDHIAQPMNLHEMQSWALFYTTTLKMRARPIVDVSDPLGVIRSQAIENEAGTVRLNLNGVDTHRTSAGAFLADHFGAPVQHIAFACGDIFETSEKLEQAGLNRLRISPNYYSNLRTLFDLTPEFVDRLQAANILYDVDGDAEYFQIFSEPLFDGFFFEVVERRNGYTGYGARNAPIRLAAMLKHKRPAGMPRV